MLIHGYMLFMHFWLRFWKENERGRRAYLRERFGGSFNSFFDLLAKTELLNLCDVWFETLGFWIDFNRVFIWFHWASWFSFGAGFLFVLSDQILLRFLSFSLLHLLSLWSHGKSVLELQREAIQWWLNLWELRRNSLNSSLISILEKLGFMIVVVDFLAEEFVWL